MNGWTLLSPDNAPLYGCLHCLMRFSQHCQFITSLSFRHSPSMSYLHVLCEILQSFSQNKNCLKFVLFRNQATRRISVERMSSNFPSDVRNILLVLLKLSIEVFLYRCFTLLTLLIYCWFVVNNIVMKMSLRNIHVLSSVGSNKSTAVCLWRKVTSPT